MGFDFRSDDVLLDIDGVCKKLSISRSSLERLRRTNPALQLRSSIAGQGTILQVCLRFLSQRSCWVAVLGGLPKS